MGQDRTVEFGVNLNNREPLIAPGYGMPGAARPVAARRGARLRLGLGRRQPLLQAALRADRAARRRSPSGRSDVKLGTACLVSSPRNPLYLALEWATLDILSGGRTIFGCCAGNPEKGVRREFEALGLDFDRRFDIFEEGLDGPAPALDRRARSPTTARPYDYDDDQLLLGHRDGSADAHPAAAAVLDRVQPAPRDRRHGRGDGAHDEDAPAAASCATARAG